MCVQGRAVPRAIVVFQEKVEEVPREGRSRTEWEHFGRHFDGARRESSSPDILSRKANEEDLAGEESFDDGPGQNGIRR